MDTQSQMKLFKTNKNIITYSWYNDKNESHKISGHLFEAIDYYLCLLQENKDTVNNYMILIPEINKLRIDQTKAAILDKYKPELQETISKAITYGRPILLITEQSLIVTDGIPPECEGHCEDLVLWLCSKEQWWVNSSRLFRINFKGITLNYLNSVHAENVQSIIDGINTIRKIANKDFFIKTNSTFDKAIHPTFYKESKWCKNDFDNNYQLRVLIYATGNCRALGDLNIAGIKNDLLEAFSRIEKTYPNKTVSLLYAGANNKDTVPIEILKDTNYKLQIIYEDELPIIDFHDRFDLYLYTPTSKNWDCSPRLLKECYYLGKPIVFCKSVLDNILENKGLAAVYSTMITKGKINECN